MKACSFCVAFRPLLIYAYFFKLKETQRKRRRYVGTRIYGFFIFLEICTFVQRGVETNDIRRIFCLGKPELTAQKSVRQCGSSSVRENLKNKNTQVQRGVI